MKKLLLAFALFAFFPAFCSPVFATVSSTTSKVIYTGNGSTSAFSFSFNVYKTTDLVVQKVLISTGVATTLTLNSDYTVSFTHTVPSPGSVTLTAGALASTYQLVILRTLPLTQLINITDPYYTTPAATWNEAHDRATMLSQQLQEQLNRGIIGPTTSSTQLALPTGVAGQCLGWDGTGTTLSNLACSGGGGGGGSGFNPPISDSQLQAITTASKVNGSALYSLSSIPVGAGHIPVSNIPTGTSSSQVVQLDAFARYPAVNGSLITNISGANFVSLASIPSGSGVVPIANIATGTPDGTKFVRDDGTLQLPTVASGLTFVSATPVAAATTSGNISITVSNNYLVVVNLKDVSVGANAIGIRINADSGGNYYSGYSGRGSSAAIGASSSGGTSFITGTTVVASSGASLVFNMTSNLTDPNSEIVSGTLSGGLTTGGDGTISTFGGKYSGAAAPTSFSIIGGGNYTGTVYLYKYQLS